MVARALDITTFLCQEMGLTNLKRIDHLSIEQHGLDMRANLNDYQPYTNNYEKRREHVSFIASKRSDKPD